MFGSFGNWFQVFCVLMCMQVLTVGVLLADVDFFGFVVLHVLNNEILVVLWIWLVMYVVAV